MKIMIGLQSVISILLISIACGSVIPLTNSNFHQTIKDGNFFIKFYAPWCGHCKELAPTWEKLSQQQTSGVKIAKVNCDESRELAKQFGIIGFPTLLF